MTEHNAAERFIVAFASIERALNEITKRPEYVPFRMNARISARYNPVVKNHLEELCSYAELRNCMVHHRDDRTEIIAYPTETTVQNIERIAELLNKDRNVLSFSTRPVIVGQIYEPARDVISRMDLHQIDRLPIYSKGSFMGILTLQQALHYVLSHKSEEEPVSGILDEITKETALFLDSRSVIQTVVRLYEDFEAIDQRSPVILITETGEHDEPPLGIITPFDLARITSYLS